MQFIIIALLCWGLWGIFDKKALEKSDCHNLVILRYLMQIIQIPILISILNTISPGWHLTGFVMLGSGLAAIGYAVALLSYLSAMNKMEASCVLGVTACYPMVAAVLAVIFLKEALDPWRLIGITIACIGVFLMSIKMVNKQKLRSTNVMVTSCLAIAILGWAICGIIDKAMVAISSPLEVYLCICAWSLVILPIMLCLYKKQGQNINIKNRKVLSLCALSALCSALGVWGYLSALSSYSASYVISITACYPALMYFCSVIFLKERFNSLRGAGITLIILGTIVVQNFV